jgi:hypothetical protein
MMAKEPADRPATPKEVVDWLAKFAKGEMAKQETVVKPKEKTVVAVKKQAADFVDFQAFTPEPAPRTTGTKYKTALSDKTLA